MNLNELRPAKGSRPRKIRVGRGEGSNWGKTSGRGQKGAGARKSAHKRFHFEGGQQPLQRRLPKRGFNSHVDNYYQVVNLADLEKHCSGEVNKEVLAKAGLIKSLTLRLKILGTGKLSKALQVRAEAYSASAKSAIESLGGKAEVG